MKLSEAVTFLIDRSPFLKEALYTDLINQSSLARAMKSDLDQLTKKSNSITAISKAIIRTPNQEILLLEKSQKDMMRSLGDIIVRSDLVDLTFSNTKSLIKSQSLLWEELLQNERIFLSLIRGVFETTIIASEKIDERIQTIFANEELLSHRGGLAAISVLLPSSNIDTRGLYYHLLKKLAWNGINLIEVISTSNEISLILDSNDVDFVFSLFINMKDV